MTAFLGSSFCALTGDICSLTIVPQRNWLFSICPHVWVWGVKKLILYLWHLWPMTTESPWWQSFANFLDAISNKLDFLVVPAQINHGRDSNPWHSCRDETHCWKLNHETGAWNFFQQVSSTRMICSKLWLWAKLQQQDSMSWPRNLCPWITHSLSMAWRPIF